MLPELGHFALILALCVACIQATVPLLGASFAKVNWMSLARPAAILQFVLLSFSFICLVIAFVSNDFSVAYVAENSNTLLPLFYKLTAIWGAHEGSMLLWVTVLGCWTCLVALFSKSLPLETVASVLAILAWISIGFLIFILATSNPFLRFLPNFPTEGQSLNPLLQDPGLVLHPPMLYMGYVGFSVAFAFAITALLTGRLDAAWARWAKPWTIAAWCFLTLGITLGSWWSYRVLGWGGWWFWDPVENASFLPWLTGTALIHSLMVTEKREAFKSWTALLAIVAFSLSLLGTFLVRSGILVSVHAFAVDAARGAYILKFLFTVVGLSLLLYAWRGNKIKGQSNFALLSRETLLLSNNVILVVSMATILLGTLYPLILQSLNLEKISVGAPYFNTVFVPLIAPFLFVMGLGPQTHWQQMPLQLLIKKLWFLFIVSLILGLALPYIFTGELQFYVALGLFLALWILSSTLQTLFIKIKSSGWKSLPLSHCGMVFAHCGVAVTVIGITFASTYSQEMDVAMGVNDHTQIGAYQFRVAKVTPLIGPNYKGFATDVIIEKNNHYLATIHPQERIYLPQNEAMSKPAISRNIFRDLYVAMGQSLGDDTWAMRIYYKPFIMWIWAGGLLMMLGGMVAMWDKRYRRGL